MKGYKVSIMQQDSRKLKFCIQREQCSSSLGLGQSAAQIVQLCMQGFNGCCAGVPKTRSWQRVRI